MPDYSEEYDDNKCVGRPLGWTGGQVQFCHEPVQLGTRFCYRCHITAIKYAVERITGLKRQLQVAEAELQTLLTESTRVPQ